MAYVSTELLLVNYFSQLEKDSWAEMPDFIFYKNKVVTKFREKYPNKSVSFDLYDITVRRAVEKYPEYFKLNKVFRDRIFLKKKIGEKELDDFNFWADKDVLEVLKESLI